MCLPNILFWVLPEEKKNGDNAKEEKYLAR
jgi:hypothetical protein